MTFPTIESIGAALRAGHVSVPEVVEATLATIAQQNPGLDAFVTVLADQARQDALERQAELDRHADRGPLHGVPIAIKDIIDIEGVRTGAGSPAFEAEPPASRDARVVTRLRDAGAILIGKTATFEIAIGPPRDSGPYPTGRNPWDRERITGGSSSGNGSAVAAGLVPGAVGTDTGGSVRSPAALCGITGLKPTWGSVSLDGIVPLVPSMDSVGPMTRTARDARLLLEPMLETAASRRWNVSRPVVIGIERHYLFTDSVQAPLAAVLEQAAMVLEGAGFPVRDGLRLEVPEDPDLLTPEGTWDCWRSFLAEAWSCHQERYERHPDLFAPGPTRSLLEGREQPAWRYVRALEQRQRLAAGFSRLFDQCDVLLAPASAALPRRFSDTTSSLPGPPILAANLAGLCGISAPGGFLEGLPVGFQLLAPPGNEALLLHAVEQFQSRTDWHLRTPPRLT